MEALLLEDVEKFTLKTLPEPSFADGDVVIQVQSVGVCGTDFHIYHGAANYNLDENGHPIPLSRQPQILGHEFSGTVIEVGSHVTGVAPGDRVAVDQGLNCFSQGMAVVCEYCTSGHSHQCIHYEERGITGAPGAMQEFVTIPAVNAVPIGPDLPFTEAALVEPLGCVIHSMDMVEAARARFTLSPDQGEPVQTVLILGSGPAGLLFLQYLRNVRRFAGQILIVDSVDRKLQLAEEMGGTPVDWQQDSIVSTVSDLTNGGKIDFLIEACGNGSAFETMPGILRKQATVLLYGHGHKGTDLSVLNRLLFLEPTLVAAVGASGRLDPQTHRPLTFQRAERLIRRGKVRVSPLITHRYRKLEEVDSAFRRDSRQADYIKGVLSPN